MKKYGILFIVLVLTATLMTGCRRPNTAPTELPPTEGMTIMPTTMPTTVPTTVAPTTEAPMDTAGTETGATDNGMTDPTDATGNARSRGRTPGMK